MKRPRPSRTTILASGLLLVLLTVLVVLTWRAWRQEMLNKELVAAVKNQDTPMVMALLQHGADPNFAYEDQSSLSLRDRFQNLWNREDASTTSVLFVALNQGNAESILALLDVGANPNGNKEVINYSPNLLLAVERPQAEMQIVRRMFEKGVQINDTDCYGKSALIAATESNRLDLASLLLENGADPNAIIGHYGPVTPLIEAVKHHNVPLVQHLLRSGAKVKLPCQGMPSLLALANGDVPLLHILQHAGATE